MEPMEVLMVGSVPLSPASEVFRAVCGSIGDLIRRVPDGEQTGWTLSVRRKIGEHEAFEPGEVSRIGGETGFGRPVQLHRLKPGRRAEDVQFPELGIAANALNSYQAFRELKTLGVIPAGLRFQVTLPGPATTGGLLQLPENELLALMERLLGTELQRIVAAIPANELAVQIDLAVEVEKEEYDRRPQDFDTPIFGIRKLTLDGTTGSAARLADRVPAGVELGFHLCAMWHLYKEAGQDLRVHVDYANRLARKTKRRIDYFHLPTTPEHDVESLAPLRALELDPRTKLFLGLIHAVDGLAGAARRIAAAKVHASGFGIGHFCGLGQWGAGPDTVRPMLEMHRAAAKL